MFPNIKIPDIQFKIWQKNIWTLDAYVVCHSLSVVNVMIYTTWLFCRIKKNRWETAGKTENPIQNRINTHRFRGESDLRNSLKTSASRTRRMNFAKEHAQKASCFWMNPDGTWMELMVDICVEKLRRRIRSLEECAAVSAPPAPSSPSWCCWASVYWWELGSVQSGSEFGRPEISRETILEMDLDLLRRIMIQSTSCLLKLKPIDIWEMQWRRNE